MNLKLTKQKLLLIGVGIIALYYFLNKFDFIQQADYTNGVAVGHTIIRFEVNHQSFEFSTVSNVEYEIGEHVKVIYAIGNPQRASVFSFIGFWYSGLILTLVPLVLWAAFVQSFINKEDKIFLRFFRKEKGKNFYIERYKLNK